MFKKNLMFTFDIFLILLKYLIISRMGRPSKSYLVINKNRRSNVIVSNAT